MSHNTDLLYEDPNDYYVGKKVRIPKERTRNMLTTEEMLTVIKTIKSTKVALHNMTEKTSVTAWYCNDYLNIRDTPDTVVSYRDQTVLTRYGKSEWQVKLSVSNLLRLVQRKNVNMVEAVISGGGFSSTHVLYMDGLWLFDTGCDDEERKIKPKTFQTDYKRTWWRIDQLQLT